MTAFRWLVRILKHWAKHPFNESNICRFPLMTSNSCFKFYLEMHKGLKLFRVLFLFQAFCTFLNKIWKHEFDVISGKRHILGLLKGCIGDSLEPGHDPRFRWRLGDTRKRPECSFSAVKPTTFRLQLRILYHWVIGDSWELQSLAKVLGRSPF